MARGRFVVFEGIDGSGKSTAIAAVAKALRADGHTVWMTREETDTWRGEAVRRSIAEGAPPLATLFHFLADRAAHVPEIEAHMAAGEHVLCDRFLHSTLAYQGVTLSAVANATAWMDGLHDVIGLRPDHVVLLDLEPHMALARVAGRGSATAYEKEGFLSQVRDAYLRLRDEQQDWTVVDASATPDQVADVALAGVQAALQA